MNHKVSLSQVIHSCKTGHGKKRLSDSKRPTPFQHSLVNPACQEVLCFLWTSSPSHIGSPCFQKSFTFLWSVPLVLWCRPACQVVWGGGVKCSPLPDWPSYCPATKARNSFTLSFASINASTLSALENSIRISYLRNSPEPS